MRLNFDTYEAVDHSQSWRQKQYELDWKYKRPRKYKALGNGTHWRVYENNHYEFAMRGGRHTPEVREDFYWGTRGTAEIVLAPDAPPLCTINGTQLLKAHTYVIGADAVLLDHEFKTALPLPYGGSIYLPWRTAQPVVTGKPGHFITYRVTRAHHRECRERRAYIAERARVIGDFYEDPRDRFEQSIRAAKSDDVIREGFKEGRFDHWTAGMYLRANDKFIHTEQALYSLAPRERHERLYLQGRRR